MSEENQNLFVNQESVLEFASMENNADRCIIAVHENVYDVTDFIDEHPGGAEAITDFKLSEALGFKDATEAFEDVGHSMDARDMMVKYQVGTIQGAKAAEHASETEKPTEAPKSSQPCEMKCFYLLPLVVVGVAAAVGFFLYKRK